MPDYQRMKIKEWSTADVAFSEQFSYFDGAICEAFLNMELDRKRAGAFHATVQSQAVGSFAINHVNAEEHDAILPGKKISRNSLDYFKFHVQNTSIAKVTQHGNESILMPGDAILIDCLYPFRIDFPFAFDCYSIKIPRVRLRPLLSDPRAAVSAPVANGSSIGKAIRHYIDFLIRLSEQPPADMQMQMFMENLLELIVAGTSGKDAGDKAVDRKRQDKTLLRIKRFVLNNLEDPDLAPKKVAAHFTISVSYLHKLFAKGGETFGNYVRDQRLERAAISLKNRSNDDQTITELAYRFGFNDLSHFWRLFRARYGTTPRKFRHAMIH